jgi:hypothetical protein
MRFRTGKGLIASLQCEPMPSETRDETHSRWTLELTGVTGRQSILKWHGCRRRREGRVTYKRHSAIEQVGEPLTTDDLDLRP